MFRSNRQVMAGLLLALTTQAAPVRAAEPPPPALDRPSIVDPVAPPIVVLVPIDPRTGRCLAGFARNPMGACVRHDEPRIACDASAGMPGSCYVAAPSPMPYGLGPNRRLNY